MKQIFISLLVIAIIQIGYMFHTERRTQRNDLLRELDSVVKYKVSREYYVNQIIKIAIKENPQVNYYCLDLAAKTIYDYGFDMCELPVNMIVAMYSVESDWNFYARSHKGALGLAQMMPETANHVARNMGYPKIEPWQLYHPVHSVKLSCYLMRYLKRKYNNNPKYYFTAYGSGENITDYLIAKHGKIPKYYLGYYESVMVEMEKVTKWMRDYDTSRKVVDM